VSALAPTLQAFFTDRLIGQKGASPNTIAGYRDTFRLLLRFVQQRTHKAPSELDMADLDAPLIAAFLEDLEIVRHNSVRTRNNRLAAVRSFFSYAALWPAGHNAAYLQEGVICSSCVFCGRFLPRVGFYFR
jgi:integrase/recombinase XerD